MTHKPEFKTAARLCRRRLAAILRRFHPDLIFTVHSFFNTLVTRNLDSLGLNIPVIVLQADLVNIHSTWCNPRARMTICPTREAYDSSLCQGMPAEKLKIMSFPVRNRFCEAAKKADVRDYDFSRPLRCLLISGGEGTCRLKTYAESILENTDAELTIVCGRNSRLYNQLQKGPGAQYAGRVNVLGFVAELEQEMLRSDLLITRGSPNTLFEAIVMALPFIMIGPLPEQEKGNPGLMQNYNLGVISESPQDVPQMIHRLLSNDGSRLREIRTSQQAWRSFSSARDIAAYVAEMTEPLDYMV